MTNTSNSSITSSSETDIANHVYLLHKPQWTLNRDCIAGQRVIKSKTTEYLPMPNSTDTTPENQALYDNYLLRASFFGAAGKTHGSLMGEVFDTKPIIKLPDELKPLEKSSGVKMSLEQQARKTLGDVIAVGRAGLLTDFPSTGGEVSRQDILSGKVKPIIRNYTAENILNWAVSDTGFDLELSYVILREYADKLVPDGKTKQDVIQRFERFRVLRFIKGVYSVSIYENNGVGEGVNLTDNPINRYFPKDHKGVGLKEIPFTFVGAENNDQTIDKAPLTAICDINISHYQNSADYENTMYLIGQPTPLITGVDDEWAKAHLKNLELGSGAVVALPQGATMELLQTDETIMARQGMQDKTQEMKELGARLSSNKITVERTALESGQDEQSETSVLGTVTNNVNDAYKEALRWAGEFVGATGEITFSLNTEFSKPQITPQEREVLLKELEAGTITLTEYRNILRDGSVKIFDTDDGVVFIPKAEREAAAKKAAEINE